MALLSNCRCRPVCCRGFVTRAAFRARARLRNSAYLDSRSTQASPGMGSVTARNVRGAMETRRSHHTAAQGGCKAESTFGHGYGGRRDGAVFWGWSSATARRSYRSEQVPGCYVRFELQEAQVALECKTGQSGRPSGSTFGANGEFRRALFGDASDRRAD